jgi:aldehyde dehydrogenase (NAD+)
VLDDADLDLAVEGILWSAFGTSGQRCTACSRVIVTPGMADRLVANLVERARALRLGPGLDPATDVGPLVDAAAVERVARYADVAQEAGAELVTGGRPAREGRLAAGHFFEPTIVDRVAPGSRVAQEEVFGPLLSVIRAPDAESAIEIANGVRYGLSSSIYTSDTSTAFRAMRALESGIVYVNAGTIGAETHLPFGGTKLTGNGHREAGHAALDTYTEWKTIYVDYSGRLQRAQIDNQP